MRRPRFINTVLWFVLVLAATAAWYLWNNYQHRAVVTRVVTPAGEFTDEVHYSPGENLEQIDLSRIDSARQSLDIAMYAFTDKFLADAVVRAARRGVAVRIYRDRSQFEDEQRKNRARNRESTTEILSGVPNVSIRIKGSQELMHLKAYSVDGKVLRDGSANWSPTGLKRQDNDARFTTNPEEVNAFARLFEELWTRSDNRIVQ